MAEREKLENGLFRIVKTVSRPSDKHLFKAEYLEIENFGQIELAANEMGLSVSDVNTALRNAKQEVYRTALGTSQEEKMQEAIKAMVAIGASMEDARAFVEAQRGRQSDLPKGLTPALDENGVQKISKKGRQKKSADAPVAEPVTA